MKKMQLSNRVTSSKNTPHNKDYVDCSAFPDNGIAAKTVRSVDRPSSKAMQYGSLTPTFFSGLDLTEIDSYCTD
jgi:hypothetical protein